MTTPLLVPQMAFNMVPADLVFGVFLAVAAAALWRSSHPLRLPLGLSYLLVLAGGSLALSQAFQPVDSAIVVVQDLYLFVWFVVLVNFLTMRGPRATRLLATAWVVTGVAVALLVYLTALTHPGPAPMIFGAETVDIFGRAKGTFRDPNLAGNYLVVSFFVLWAAPRPRRLLTKALLSVPFVLAVYVTDSITALVTLAGGFLIALFLGFLSARQTALALSAVCVAVMVATVTLLPPTVESLPKDVAAELGSTAAFQDSLGRTEVSATGRIVRWNAAIAQFGDQMLIGIGAGSTTPALLALRVPGAGELHNDYLAAFLERGVVGGVGVLALFAVVAGWALRLAGARSLIREGWRPAFLAGAVGATLAAALALETLHFRHVWLLLALLCALTLQRGGATTRRPAAPTRSLR